MGTDYNEGIDIALRNVDAVLMVVTPNVLAEGSYVKTIEYQREISYGKPIVAVELAATDRRAFIEAFPEVDYYISLPERASSEAEKNYEEFPCNETLRDLRSVHSRLGKLYTVCAEVYGERQLLQLACKYKIEAAEMGNNIYKEWMSTHNLMNLLQDFIEAGDVCYLAQDYVKAKTYYNKATNAFVRLRQKDLANLSEHTVLTVYAPNMDRAYLRLSEICYEFGDAQDAAASYAMYQQITQVLGTEK